jgi:methionine synthase II (cobalamin-independent)
MALGLRGLATGIGSLPHTNPEQALDLIFKYTPHVPFWPQLPRRDAREGMVAQYVDGLPCIEVTRKGVFYNGRNKEKQLEAFYERIIARDIDYFSINEDCAAGFYAFYQRLVKSDLASVKFIKVHLTGPFTIAASIKDEKQRALVHDPVLMQAIQEGLAMKALWQLKMLGKFGKKMILFIDEPYLGCFGSAYTSINREDVVASLTALTGSIKSAGALIGVHCCGNTDWSIFTDIEHIDIINFDAFSFLEKVILYSDSLTRFMQRHGALCWGIVPTQKPETEERAGVLTDMIQQGLVAMEKKGLSPQVVLQDLCISPSCGLGTLDEARAEACFKLLAETAACLDSLK